jgi:hypothetical protein
MVGGVPVTSGYTDNMRVLIYSKGMSMVEFRKSLHSDRVIEAEFSNGRIAWFLVEPDSDEPLCPGILITLVDFGYVVTLFMRTSGVDAARKPFLLSVKKAERQES